MDFLKTALSSIILHALLWTFWIFLVILFYSIGPAVSDALVEDADERHERKLRTAKSHWDSLPSWRHREIVESQLESERKVIDDLIRKAKESGDLGY